MRQTTKTLALAISTLTGLGAVVGCSAGDATADRTDGKGDPTADEHPGSVSEALNSCDMDPCRYPGCYNAQCCYDYPGGTECFRFYCCA